MAENTDPPETAGGTLWVVATPIGNLGDVSRRAIEVLRAVDLVAAEDTRHSRRLFAACDIRTRLQAYHEHNEREQVPRLLAMLEAGKSIALISDAGTPLISDPGYQLVRRAREAGITCRPVPGPSALIAALSVAGLPSDRFCFEGFLPPKSAARRRQLETCRDNTHTVIYYESAHRIEPCLADMREILGGQRQIVLARELTKAFETVLCGTVEEIIQLLAADSNQRKGEFVVLIGPVEKTAVSGQVSAATRELFALLCEELPASRAARLAARISGESRQAIFASRKPG